MSDKQQSGLLFLTILLGPGLMAAAVLADNSPGLRYWLALTGAVSTAFWMVLMVTIVGRLNNGDSRPQQRR